MTVKCSKCNVENDESHEFCKACGNKLEIVVLTYGGRQKTSQKKKFKWWKLFTWPFVCLGTIITGCCECCCESTCGSSSSQSSSLKEDIAEEAIETVVDALLDD